MADGDVKIATTWPSELGDAPTNILINDVKKRYEPDEHISLNGSGAYYGGRLKKTKVVLTVSGECLEGGQAEIVAKNNTGAGTAASPRVTVEVGENNENPHSFTLTAWYFSNTQASFKA